MSTERAQELLLQHSDGNAAETEELDQGDIYGKDTTNMRCWDDGECFNCCDGWDCCVGCRSDPWPSCG